VLNFSKSGLRSSSLVQSGGDVSFEGGAMSKTLTSELDMSMTAEAAANATAHRRRRAMAVKTRKYGGARRVVASEWDSLREGHMFSIVETLEALTGEFEDLWRQNSALTTTIGGSPTSASPRPHSPAQAYVEWGLPGDEVADSQRYEPCMRDRLDLTTTRAERVLQNQFRLLENVDVHERDVRALESSPAFNFSKQHVLEVVNRRRVNHDLLKGKKWRSTVVREQVHVRHGHGAVESRLEARTRVVDPDGDPSERDAFPNVHQSFTTTRSEGSHHADFTRTSAQFAKPSVAPGGATSAARPAPRRARRQPRAACPACHQRELAAPATGQRPRDVRPRHLGPRRGP
jgi:hypothetical protein